MAHSQEVERLLGEFKAQDHGVQLVVMQGFNRVVAASYSEGNENWELTQAGKDLLNPPVELETKEKVKPPRNIDVRVRKA